MCWVCENVADNDECLQKGRAKMCQPNEVGPLEVYLFIYLFTSYDLRRALQFISIICLSIELLIICLLYIYLYLVRFVYFSFIKTNVWI